MTPFPLRSILEFLCRTQAVERASSWPESAVPEPADPNATTAVEPITVSPAIVPSVVLEEPANAQPQLPGFFDHRHLSVRDQSKFTKRSKRTRQLDTIDLICVHQMAVEFGVSKNAVRRWVKFLEKNPEALVGELASYDMGDVEATARRIALHERFWNGVPYHVISLLNGDIAINQRFDWRTWHGNGGNSGLGWSQEGLFPYSAAKRRSKHTKLDSHVIETGQASFRLAVLKARELGCPIRYVQPHRCYSNGRFGDTGEEIWREILLPLFDELELIADYELKLGGRPIPRDWDDAALYDARGRRIKIAA